jgi:hypothetical protein
MYRKVRGYEIGPIYGAVTEDFLPVLGVPHYYKSYSDTPETEEAADPWKSLTILNDGFGSLVSLKLIEGDFELSGQNYDPPLPSLWSSNDGMVASKLVYREDMLLPHVFFRVHEIDYRKISYVTSTPKWILDTDFGRTQFCILYWLHIMARFPERLQFAYQSLCEPHHYEMAQNLVKELKAAKQKRVFEAHDEFTKIYTDIFNKYVFELLPVFQRYSILTAVTYGMYNLKIRNLKPSEKYFKTIIDKF